MKVVHIEAGRHLYGGAAQVIALIDGLARRGVDSVLICRPDSEIAHTSVRADIRPLPMAGELDAGLPWRIAAALRGLEFDLLHAHSRRGADLYGGMAARRLRRPAVVTRRVESSEPAPWLRFKLRQYDAVVAISRTVERLLAEHAGLAAGRLHRVPSGVDTNRFRPDPQARRRLLEQLGLGDDALIVAVAAQLIARKGHAVLFDAWSQVMRHRPSAVLAVFGRGPLEPVLRARAGSLGIGGSVHFLGHQPALDGVLPGVDVLVHPALREGLGLVLLEALATGVAVIASSTGGIVDVIRDGIDGHLVPPGDPHRLAGALVRLIDDPSLRRRLGKAGRRRIIDAFSLEQMAAGNLRVYETVLGGA